MVDWILVVGIDNLVREFSNSFYDEYLLICDYNNYQNLRYLLDKYQIFIPKIYLPSILIVIV